VHSYVLYPLILRWLSRNKDLSFDHYSRSDELPEVTIMMAVYNEEPVLEEKLNSIFENDYPLDKIQILIGSDNSTDNTNQILQKYADQYPQLSFQIFDRQGKANILNQLSEMARGSIYIFTDANVFFSKTLIYELVKYFKTDSIGQVGAYFQNVGMKKAGIGGQEKAYIDRESQIKFREGLLWGSMMGAFGGCYAIRSDCFTKNPPNYYMEDFYLSMYVLSLNKKAILNPEAKVKEDVPNNVAEEFKRKTRISIGNYQNLRSYYSLLFPLSSGLGFSFLSHKVIRWIGPFLLLFALLSNVLLVLLFNQFGYQLILFLQLFAYIAVPIFDQILKRIGIHLSLFRYISYFILMNIALMKGFFNFVKGVDNNVWQPTKRNV
jgi:cellulose synthase/poly-beta-1,6-N-acetylglucosamine synthase-like glycosyltransferase